MKVASLSVLWALAASTGPTAGLCPPSGPVLPVPPIPSDLDPSDLSSRLDTMIDDPAAPWNISTTSFSVEITTAKETFFQYHHTANIRHGNGTDKVDSNTVYRVASVTKAFNVLTLLLNARVELDSPISQFIPELDGSETYADVTLRMLAGSLSGVARDGKGFDLYLQDGEALQESGFPAPPQNDIPSCDGGMNRLCSRKEFFDTLLQNELMWLPADKAAYSNQAYTVIGFALEAITGKPFTELLEQSICDELGLDSTGFDVPDLSRTSIPVGDGAAFAGMDIGNFKPTAGLYSTPRDLAEFVRSILGHTIMSPRHIREWLKPVAFAGSLSTAIGMPWEISRLTNLTPDGRPIDIYVKLGSIYGYSAYVVLIPDYEIGASIIASGTGDDPDAMTLAVLDLITNAAVSAVDGLSRDHARDIYGGEYVGTSGNGTEATIAFTVDDGPGLRIDSWTNDGKPILEALAAQRALSVEDVEARLYPVGQGDRWWMALEPVGSGDIEISAPSGACSMWEKVDHLRYAGLPLDEFRFRLEDGLVVGVENAGLRASWEKQ